MLKRCGWGQKVVAIQWKRIDLPTARSVAVLLSGFAHAPARRNLHGRRRVVLDLNREARYRPYRLLSDRQFSGRTGWLGGI